MNDQRSPQGFYWTKKGVQHVCVNINSTVTFHYFFPLFVCGTNSIGLNYYNVWIKKSVPAPVIRVILILSRVKPGLTLVNFTYATTRAFGNNDSNIAAEKKKKRQVCKFHIPLPPSALHLHMTTSHELAFGAKIK